MAFELGNLNLQCRNHYIFFKHLSFVCFLKNTPYPLLVDLFQSLVHISNFFVDVQQFEWMLDNSLTLHRQLLSDDPASLESALVGCILKSASFIPLVKKLYKSLKI